MCKKLKGIDKIDRHSLLPAMNNKTMFEIQMD